MTSFLKFLRETWWRIWPYIYRSLDFLIPKHPRLVVFSQAKERYSDNCRALYEYMTLSPPSRSIRPVWLAQSGKAVGNIRSRFPAGTVLRSDSWIGLWTALRARVAVISHGMGDLGRFSFVSSHTRVVFLWHGIAIKKYGLTATSARSSRVSRAVRRESRKWALVTSTSDVDRYLQCVSWGLDAAQVVETGLPRNDALVNAPLEKAAIPLPPNGDCSIDSRILRASVVLYAPTFREGSETRFFPFDDFDPVELETALEVVNAYVLLRPHQNDLNSLVFVHELCKRPSGRFVIADAESVPDVVTILPFVDVVVTDYSSIYIDLLLRDVPCLFVPYDLQEYQRDRGLAYDYDLVTPGPKVRSMSEFVQGIDSALRGDSDYGPHRRLVTRLFHAHADAGSCERVCAQIVSLLCVKEL